MRTEDTTKMAESPAHKISLRNLTNPNSRNLLQNNQHGKMSPISRLQPGMRRKKTINKKTKQTHIVRDFSWIRVFATYNIFNSPTFFQTP